MRRSGPPKYGSEPKPTGTNEDHTGGISRENVRTLASTKYFEDWSGRGAWSIVIANRAVADLRRMRKGDSHVFGMHSLTGWLLCLAVPVSRELSQGFFSDDNQKRLVGLNTEVPVYEAKVSRDLRIVYQIDLDTDFETNMDKQIIKLYGIYTHAQMDNRLGSLIAYYNTTRRGKEYRKRCSFCEIPRTLGNNVTPPAQFPHEEDIEAPSESRVAGDSASDQVMNDKDLLDVHSVVASEKFLLLSKSLVKSIIGDFDGGHIFQVSPREKEVIYYDSACFVLGRSGTGKTTCIVFKMLGIERMFEEAKEAKPRQVFITQSPELAQKVQEYYHALVRTNCHHSPPSNRTAAGDEPILADLGDESIETFGLPKQYSQLEDRHFPLFLSFDQLCSLLEEDFKSEFGRLARSQEIARRFDPSFNVELDKKYELDKAYINEQLLPAVWTMEKIKENKNATVKFDVFVFAYWPHFDQSLTYDLDPALVYNEFIGVIEGSEDTLACPSGILSRDEYLALGHGSSLLASRRDKVYTLYESYRRARGQLGGYDAAERTHALLVATQNGKRIPGPKIDALYVDEVQDNLMVDSKLLSNLSDNPHGILMAGDTAQALWHAKTLKFSIGVFAKFGKLLV